MEKIGQQIVVQNNPEQSSPAVCVTQQEWLQRKNDFFQKKDVRESLSRLSFSDLIQKTEALVTEINKGKYTMLQAQESLAILKEIKLRLESTGATNANKISQMISELGPF